MVPQPSFVVRTPISGKTIFTLKREPGRVGGGWGFIRWWPPSSMWVGPPIFSSTTTRDVWMIPSFRIWNYVLHVEHISCVIMNCGQHQWAVPCISIALYALLEENNTWKLLFLYADLFFKILLFHVAFLILLRIVIFFLTFFWLGCYCSMWLCFSPGLVKF